MTLSQVGADGSTIGISSASLPVTTMPCWEGALRHMLHGNRQQFLVVTLWRRGAGIDGHGGSGSMQPSLVLHTQRPRVLICGREGSGQSHLGPAVLDVLEGLPVHSIGLPSLLSDVSARYACLTS